MSKREAAAALGIGLTKLDQLIGCGKLPSITIDRRRLVLVADLNAFVVELRKQQRGRLTLVVAS